MRKVFSLLLALMLIVSLAVPVLAAGGSTIAGVAKLEEKGFRGAVMQAVCAADARNKELGK